MIQTIQLFAQAKEIAQQDHIKIDLPREATVYDLRQQLVIQFPELATIAEHLLIAINNEYVADETPVNQHDTIACFPPVSGG